MLEIPTRRGYAYAQFTHVNQKMGELIRVLPGFFKEPVKDIEQIVNQKERFFVFFPVAAAVSRGIFRVAAHAEVPDRCRAFPTFRGAGLRDARGEITWWLWDGAEEVRVPRLSEEMKRLPIMGIVNDAMLVHMIETEWLPEKDKAKY